MKSLIDEWYCGTINNERGMNAKEIECRISSTIETEHISHYSSIIEAYNKAIESLRKEDRLIVYGSFYTVSEILKYKKFTKKIVINA